jgi:hypothetical protein
VTAASHLRDLAVREALSLAADGMSAAAWEKDAAALLDVTCTRRERVAAMRTARCAVVEHRGLIVDRIGCFEALKAMSPGEARDTINGQLFARPGTHAFYAMTEILLPLLKGSEERFLPTSAEFTLQDFTRYVDQEGSTVRVETPLQQLQNLQALGSVVKRPRGYKIVRAQPAPLAFCFAVAAEMRAGAHVEASYRWICQASAAALTWAVRDGYVDSAINTGVDAGIWTRSDLMGSMRVLLRHRSG